MYINLHCVVAVFAAIDDYDCNDNDDDQLCWFATTQKTQRNSPSCFLDSRYNIFCVYSLQ